MSTAVLDHVATKEIALTSPIALTFPKRVPAGTSKASSAPAEIKITPTFLQPNYRPLTLLERVFYAIRCPKHTFSWPHTRTSTPKQTTYLKGFDSHQSCTKCGVQRFFNQKTFESGPMFYRLDEGSSEHRQQNAFDTYVEDVEGEFRLLHEYDPLSSI